jgi:hypothetical protein
MAKAADEMSHYYEYDWVIVNRSLPESLGQVRAILTSERLRRRRQTGLSDFVKRSARRALKTAPPSVIIRPPIPSI